MKKETPKSYERDLYENCPALASYERQVLGDKIWLENNFDQNQRAVANKLMGGEQGGNESVDPVLRQRIEMLVGMEMKKAGGDESIAVRNVFNALMAVTGHRHTANYAAAKLHLNKQQGVATAPSSQQPHGDVTAT